LKSWVKPIIIWWDNEVIGKISRGSFPKLKKDAELGGKCH